MSFNDNDRLMTVTEAAKFLKLSVLTLYKYIKDGNLEAVQFGGRYRIKQSSLDRFILEHIVSMKKEENL